MASIEEKRSEYGAGSLLASKAVEGTCTAASADTEMPDQALSAQDKVGEEQVGLAGKVLASSGVEGAGCGRSEHVVMAEILENRGVGVASRGEDEVDGRRGTEIQVSGSTATFLGGSSPHSEAVFQQFRRLQNPQKLARKFEARSGLTVRVHLRRSSACPAHLPMRTHPRSLRPRGQRTSSVRFQ